MKEDQERTPLRTILTNFLNHIENLEARRSSEDSYESEFQELKLFSESIKGTKQFSCSEGEKEVNRKKNRYKDILPFDISRVSLIEYAGIPGSDYINANFIKGASGSPAYIASQGPLPHTVNDFWRMVVQCEVQVIVMACNEEEAGKHKCENYWVEEDGEEKQFGMVSIRLIKASTVCPDFSVRTMRLKYTNSRSVIEERTVCQFHYSAWPDHGVPPLVRPLLDMVRLVRDTQASETLPVLVHCSAGCGRTGTICAIDYVWGLLRAGKLTKDFSLLSLVREMRKQRIAMVQTKEQYVLVHQAVRELFKEQLRMIDSHPYENIDSNGLPLIKSPCPETEPTYDTVSTYHLNNTSEEKQDEKEKETIAPPIPQKKKFILSSKQEKEVENLSERQRLVEQAESSSESIASSNASGTSSGHRPRIAKLKSFFERNSATRESRRGPHVSRSHSLGAVRNSKSNPSLVNSESGFVDKELKEIAVKENSQPIPYKGILRVPQVIDQPVLPVKRSKSLRILGTGDRYKLSIPAGPPTTHEIDISSNSTPDRTRRLSLESNIDEMRETERNLSSNHGFSQLKHSQDCMPVGVVDAIVAGLGVRERRNSFRQAMNRAGPEQTVTNRKDHEIIWSTPHRRPGLLRSYTSIDMRTVHAQSVRQNLASIAGSAKMDKSGSAPAKPLVRPKPFVYNSGAPKPLNKSTDVSANKFLSNSFHPSKDNRQQPNQNTSFNHFPNTPITSLQNNPRPMPRANRLIEDKPNVISKQVPPPSNYSSRPVLSRQKDLSYPFKTEYINANRAKILHPVGHSVLPSCSGGISTQIDIKSSSALRDSLQKPFSLDSRISENSKGGRTMSSSPRNNDQSVCNQLVNSNKPNQDSTQNINTRHNHDHSSVERKSNESKSLSRSHELQSQQNFRQIQQATTSSPKTHLDMVRKNSSKQQFQPPSTSRPVVYDSRNRKQDPVAIYGTRPKAPPPYLEASRQNIYNRSHIDPQKTSSFDYDRRYNAHSHQLKMHNDSVQARDSSQFLTVKQNSIQTDDRVKGMEIREAQNYNQFNNPQYYSHKVIQDMRSNPQSFHDTMVHEIKSNQQSVYDNRVPEAKSNASPLQDTRTHEMRSNILHLQDSRAQELRSNEPLQDSRVHEVKSNAPLQDRVNETRANQPVFQNSSSKNTQSTKIYEMRSNPPLHDDRQGKQKYLHHSSNRNPQVEPVYRSDKSQPIDVRSNAEPDSGNHSVKLRRGSRDDLALCSNSTPSRVKRHASVVMLRHSLIENPNSSGPEGQQAAMPLTVWNQGGKESRNTDIQGGQFSIKCEEDPWSGAVGIDLDHVAASIPLKDGTSTKYMRAALESLHLRKGTSPQAIENVESKPSNPHTVNSQSTQSAQTFRKQQQYL